jgi:hypothetical protein
MSPSDSRKHATTVFMNTYYTIQIRSPPLLHPNRAHSAPQGPMPVEDGVLALEPLPLPSPDRVTGKSLFFASCSPLYSPRLAFPSRAAGGGGAR